MPPEASVVEVEKDPDFTESAHFGEAFHPDCHDEPAFEESACKGPVEGASDTEGTK